LPAVFPLIRRHAGSSVLAARWGIDAGDNERAGFVFELLREGIEAGRIEVIACRTGDEVSGALLWDRLPWDSHILGTSCARILLLAGEDCGVLLSFWRDRAVKLGIVYAIIRVPERPPGMRSMTRQGRETQGSGDRRTDRPRESIGGSPQSGSSILHELLTGEGFSRIEQLVFMSRGVDAPPPAHEVTEAAPGEIETVAGIAAASYSFDRFHSEPLFGKEAADRVHERWCRGSFEGRADAVLAVRDEDGCVAGYCTCMLPRRVAVQPGWIDMLAVRSGSRRAGFGESLVLGALRFFRNANVTAAALSTQYHNRPALRLYEKSGFSRYFEAFTYRTDLRDGQQGSGRGGARATGG
jgi:ribosomal protein S18 acetylase RimI-like enzyme